MTRRRATRSRPSTCAAAVSCVRCASPRCSLCRRIPRRPTVLRCDAHGALPPYCGGLRRLLHPSSFPSVPLMAPARFRFRAGRNGAVGEFFERPIAPRKLFEQIQSLPRPRKMRRGVPSPTSCVSVSSASSQASLLPSTSLPRLFTFDPSIHQSDMSR